MADSGDGYRPEIEEIYSEEAQSSGFTKHVFLFLKAGNLGLITFYSFAIIYVLVRVISPSFYPWIVFITSVGNYILASDLGFGGYVYASLRKSFIQGSLHERGEFVAEALATYFYIAIGSAAVAAAIIFATVHVGPSMKLAIACYFCTIVLALPWSLTRRITQAIDCFFAMEVLELARRAMTVLLAGSMLLGVSFLTFAIMSLALWAVAFSLGLWLMHRKNIPLRIVSLQRVARFIGGNRQHVLSTSKLTGFEFVMYNHPYVVLPFLIGNAGAIVAYDVFYKFMRFGGVAYAVAIETFLPYQTRAYHRGDAREVRRYRWKTVALSLIPWGIASVFLLTFGQKFMTGLLSSAHPIDPNIRKLTVVMLTAILFQAPAGVLLVAVGEYNRLGNLAAFTVSVMAACSLIVYLFHLPLIAFMSLFVAAYCLHTIMYQVIFHRQLSAITRQAHT